jgi:hypothetical protein
MPNLSGNKGEWSEIYTLLKLLGDGKLYGADGDLNKKTDVFYDLLQIIRNENIGCLIFEYNHDDKIVRIKNENGEIYNEIPSEHFGEEAVALFEEIKTANTSSFTVPRTCEFMDEIYCSKLKAPSEDKSDITIKIHDFNTGLAPTLGFSIKSRLGKPATLLNAGTTTNCIFEIDGGFNDNNLEEINNLFSDKVKPDGSKDISVAKRIKYLSDNNFELKYYEMNNKTFQNNLIMIDTALPEIVANALLEYYFNGVNNIKEALKNVTARNPLNFNLSEGHDFYNYKFKKLLTESALGMLPGKVWTGVADASGGYIIVKEDGDIVCYHLYNRNDFEDYLLNNTRFDRGGAGRHQYATAEKNNGKYYIKLNLQIRFIK